MASLDLILRRLSVSHRSTMRVRVYPLLGLLALGLGAFSRGAAADITTDSPFMPAGGGAAPAAITEGAAIELHGVMTTSEGTSFSIYDTAKKSSQWVRINQAGSPFVVRSHNLVDGNDEVKVDYQGSSLTLALKTPKIGSMPKNAPAIAGMPANFNRPGPGGPNPITQTVVVNPTPADEAARLQAVVDAVAARRAARNQAVQQGGAPNQPPVNQTGVAQPAPQNQPMNGNGQRGNQNNRNRPGR